MKFCTKCGNKLNENVKYCPKCGNPTRLQLEKLETQRKQKKEEKRETALLYLGASLIVIASLIFAFSNWNEMSYVFRILFLLVEMIIFLTLSIFSKGFKNKLPYKTLWFIGLLFLPVITILIANYGIFGKYLSYEGAGIFVYLSISFLLCSVLNIFSYKLLNSKIFIYMSYIYIYALIINVLNIFNLHCITSDNINIVFPVLCIINLIIVTVINFINDGVFRRALNKFMSILSLFFAVILLIVLFDNKLLHTIFNLKVGTLLSNILVSIGFVTILISLLVLMKKKNRGSASYIYPLLISFCIIGEVDVFLGNNVNLCILITVLFLILSYFIINLFNNKGYRITSFIIMLFITYISMVSNIGYRFTLIISLMVLITKLFTSKIHNSESEYVISSLLYPLDTVLIVSSILGILEEFNYIRGYIAVYIISSLICFIVHIILENKSKYKLNKIIQEIFSYLFLGISSIMILGNDGTIILFILNELTYVYYFLYRTVKKKEKSMNTLIYVLLLINLLVCSVKFDIPLYYLLLFISFINIIMYIVMLKVEKMKIKPYFYISFILSIIASLYNFSNYSLIGVCANVILYSLVYIISNKNVKIDFISRYIYTVVGFIIIYKLFDFFITESVFVNALSLISYIIIIISMFLLEVDSDRQVLAYTPVIVPPYINLINEIDIFSNIQTEMTVLITVILILIFSEKVFKIKRENDKVLLELILLIFVSLISIYDMLIFNFILAIFYIFFGLYKKRDSFVVYGVVLILISVFINLFKIADNLLSTYILLLLGATLVIYVFCKESKRNKRK